LEDKNIDINWRLIIRVIQNRASDKEMDEFNSWVKYSDRNWEIFQEIKKVYKDNNDNASAYSAASAFNAFKERNSIVEDTDNKEPQRKRLRVFRRVTSVAASLFVLLSIGFYINYHRSVALVTGKSIAADLIWKKITTLRGQQMDVILSDGSSIRLLAGSTLVYPEPFAKNERKVFLEGEGFFKVSKDSTKPFIVETDHLQTRVLGTSFNITSYKDQQAVSVTVVSGKVAVSKNREGAKQQIAYLLPNERVIYNSDADSFNVTSVHQSISKALSEGKLVFEENTMIEIATKIERFYNINVSVKLSDKRLLQKHLTATFDYMSLDNLLPLLREVSGLSFEKVDSTLYIQ
jgi:transmembrane sensor